MTVEADDHAGSLYEVIVRELGTDGVFDQLSRLRSRGLTGRLLHRMVALPPPPPGMRRYHAAAMPLEGDLPRHAGTTIINARSILEALTEAVETLESGSFPKPGEPTYL